MRAELYIGGVWREGAGEQFSSHNPASGDKVWQGRAATADDVAEAMAAARLAFPAWSRRPLEERVAIARALVHQPALLLADEPTGNLDSQTGQEIMGEFQRLNREYGQTIVMVTHEADIAAHSSRIVTMRDGQIASDAPHAGRPWGSEPPREAPAALKPLTLAAPS